MSQTTREERYAEFWPGDKYADFWPRHYKLGMWAWLLHRFTALFIIGYGLVHLGETALGALQIFNITTYDWFYEVVGLSQFIQGLDIVLVTALLYHGLNGLRIMLMDFFSIGIRTHKTAFWTIMAVGAVIWGFFLKESLPWVIGRPIA